MPKYVRFVYAACSTAAPANMREHLLDIEKIGSKLNAILEMRGVLIYGSGYFLHYIEGLEDQINEVYDISMQSTYTKDFKLLKREYINKVHFNSWNIKYFIKEEALQKFYQKQGLGSFNPYKLSGDTLDELLYLLRQQDEVITKTFMEQYESLLHEMNHADKTVRSIPFNYIFLALMFIILIILGVITGWHFHVIGSHP